MGDRDATFIFRSICLETTSTVGCVIAEFRSVLMLIYDLFVCEEGSVDQGFGLMINTLLFIDSNDKMKPTYKRMIIKFLYL